MSERSDIRLSFLDHSIPIQYKARNEKFCNYNVKIKYKKI